MLPALLALLAPIVGKVIDKFGTDVELDMKKVEIEGELERLLLANQDAIFKVALGQIEINKAEASSGDKFASRWRPLIGYTCGVALMYHTILYPLLEFMVRLGGVEVVLPTFDLNQLLPVLLGMLGLGAMRTYEKVRRRA